MREQDLSDAVAVLVEHLFVHMHQPGLADGGGGLPAGYIGRPLFKPEARHAHRNGAGGDKQRMHAGPGHVGDGPHKLVDVQQIQPPVLVGQGGGAHLDHQFSHLIHRISPYPVLKIKYIIP